MRIRLISMNKVAALQRDTNGDDQWEMVEVAKRCKLEPGVYRLFESVPAHRDQQHLGLILYKYDGTLYQQTPAGIVRHPVKCFQRLPPVGQSVMISYENRNKASFLDAPGAAKGVRRTLSA